MKFEILNHLQNTFDHRINHVMYKKRFRYDWLDCGENWLGWKSKAKVHAIKKEPFLQKLYDQNGFQSSKHQLKRLSLRCRKVLKVSRSQKKILSRNFSKKHTNEFVFLSTRKYLKLEIEIQVSSISYSSE